MNLEADREKAARTGSRAVMRRDSCVGFGAVCTLNFLSSSLLSSFIMLFFLRISLFVYFLTYLSYTLSRIVLRFKA